MAPGVSHTGLMTAPQPGRHTILDRPSCTPAAIRAVLAANADPEILSRYDRELDAAFERARDDGDLGALMRTVKRWWFEADSWRDPEAHRAYLARVDQYLSEGPPPPEQRVTRDQVRARLGL